MSRRFMIAVLAILSLSLLVGPARAGINTWTAGGPTGGAIRAVLVEDPTLPTASSTVYVGTLGSGVFKSTTGGDTWVPKGLDGFTIRALVRDPVLATLYAGAESGFGGAPGGVFSSVNGGDTWLPVDDAGLLNKTVQALALDGSTLYAGTAGGGVFRLDAGTWTQVNTGLTALQGECSNCPLQVLSLATDSRTPGIVYAGTEGAGLYKTVNSGASWARHPTTTNQGFRADCLEKAEILAVLVDVTEVNETLYVGAKGSVGNSGCSTIVNEPGVGQGPGFFRWSSNDPLWDRKMNGMYGEQIPPTFTLNVWAIAMSAGAGEDFIYVGTDFGVFRSDDRGQSWDGVPRMHNPPAPSDLVGLPIRALAVSSNGTPTLTTTLYAGSVGRGMFRRENVGNPIGDHAWTERNIGLTALRAKAVAVVPVIAQPAPSRILGGLSSGGVVKSDDSGATWQNTTETPPPTHYPAIARTVNGIAVDPSDLTTIYAATGRGVIKSTDRGNTWTPKSSGLPTKLDPPIFCDGGCSGEVNPLNFTVPRDVKSIAVDPANRGVLYAAVGGVYTSVDGGENWVALNGTLPGPVLPTDVTSGDGKVSALVVDPKSGDPIFGTLYAATSGFGVYRSVNGGNTWTASTGLAADPSITALVLDPLTGASVNLYAGTSTGKVYRSVNGSNWTLLSTGLPGNPITALAIRLAEPTTVIYAALSGAGVYYLENGSTIWQVLDNTGLSLDVAGLAVDATQSPQTLYAATLGRGMHDFAIVPPTAPTILLDQPEGPYPVEASSSTIAVVAIGLNTTAMFWSTNRGYAGLAIDGLGDTWTAPAIPLERGLNLITLTAVNAASNEASTSLTVNLPDFDPEISASPSPMPFGTVTVGSQSALQIVTVQNIGTADLVIGTITRGGANPGEFKKASANDLCSGVTLGPNLTCTVGLKFAPLAAGARSATLLIPSNDPVTSVLSVTLTGTGAASTMPVISASPSPMPFGTVAVGSTSALQIVTVQNNGTANLVIGTITRGGANPGEFKKASANDLCSGITLAPTLTCTVGLKFAPLAAGARSATLLIPSNDPVTSVLSVTLTGTGGAATPVISASPSPMPFGTVNVGSTSALQIVTVQNNGTANLVIGTITRGGTNPGEFKKASANDLCSGVTLAPTQTCTVGLKFAPLAPPGAKSATLLIPSNDPVTSVLSVPLTGTAL